MNTMKLLLLSALVSCSDSPVAPASDPLEDIPEHHQSFPISIGGTRVAGEAWYWFRAGRWVYRVDVVGGRRVFESGGGYWVGEWDAAHGWSVGWEREYRWQWDFENEQADTSFVSTRWSGRIVPRAFGVEINDEEFEYR